MGRKYKIVSGDGHVETPPDGWLKYVPEQNRDRAPRLIRLPGGADGGGDAAMCTRAKHQGPRARKFANALFNEDARVDEGGATRARDTRAGHRRHRCRSSVARCSWLDSRVYLGTDVYLS